jgi:heme-degrading monooxygenase HmoA
MFVVLFEVRPADGRTDDYLAHAAELRPELLAIDGFIDNIRYGACERPGVILSLSTWRDEKSLIRWRTHARHHDIQVEGNRSIFEDYHLRVGEVVEDTHVPEGHLLRTQRLDATEIGEALVTVVQASEGMEATGAESFAAILTPGDHLLLGTGDRSRNVPADGPAGARRRLVRVIRDYGRRDRREAPQYFPLPA